jgi:hypothetical protein
MMALIAAAQHSFTSLVLQNELAKIGPYVSRGHGGKHRGSSSRPNLRSKFPSGKYTPHQGKKECERRRYQAVAAKIKATKHLTAA